VDPRDLTGKTLKGYELTERIGAGGFGAVYKAYQPLVKRDVAVKVILPNYTNNAEFVRRFEAEAQLVANLEHPYIVPLYDFWRDADGAFLVMRWLRGGSMQAVIRRGHWPLTDIPRVLDQITGALAVAHRNGVIHRDIKPENILLDEDHNAYLADFGIAKDLNRISDAAEFIEEAEEERLIGSPDFMSPEQIQMSPLTPQSDIYSLGVVLYMMLTGRKPFTGENISTVISKHLYEPFPHIQDIRPDLPDRLNQVIEKATQKQPTERYSDVITMSLAFRQAMVETDTADIAYLDAASFAGVNLPTSADNTELNTSPTMLPLADQATQGLFLEPENPYKGLRAFQEADAADFFGRTEQVNALLDRLAEATDDAQARFLSIVGASGSGKSSIVRAGIIPALRRDERWFVTDMTPSTHPIEELEAALLRVAVNPPASLIQQLTEDERGLARATKRVLPSGDDSHTELVLFIDQFEEVFTLVESESERSQFLGLIQSAVTDPNSRLRIITTLRADFYDRPLMYPEFGGLVRECTEVVLPLSRNELLEAIVEPARSQGLTLEDGLSAAILTDVSEQPGILPMMQYALTELFERRQGTTLTRSAYEEIGGVSGALARRAEDIFNELPTEEQTLSRQIFVRLVTLGEGTEDTRRRALLAELLAVTEDTDTVQAIIDRFGAFRLLTFDNDPVTRSPTVEVAHEALIRQWERLREWLEESRDDLRTQRKLNTAAREWETANQDNSYLVSGTRLESFETWIDETSVALTATESDFLHRSIVHRNEQQEIEKQRIARESALQKRSRNVLRALVGVMSAAALIAIVLSTVAFNQTRVAQSNAATAVVAQSNALREAENAATAAAVAATNEREAASLAYLSAAQVAVAEDNAERALLLAIESVQQGNPSLQARRTLANVAYAPATRNIYLGHEDRIESVTYNADGSRLLSGGDDGLVILWDAETHEEIRRFSGHEDFVWDVALSLDGTLALSGSKDGTAILWNIETGDQLHRLGGHNDEVQAVAFAPNGLTALTGSHDQTMILWDLVTGEELLRFGEDGSGHSNQINDIAFSSGGFTALSSSEDGSVILWNIATGQPLLRYEGENGGIYTVIYTPDELGMVTGAFDGTVLLWSFETGQPVRRFEGHTDRVTGISFSPDASQIVTSSQDGTAVLWDFESGTPIQRYVGHTDRVYGIVHHPSQPRFVTAGWDRTLRSWDTTNGAQLAEFAPHTDDVYAVSSNNNLIASASADGTIVVIDIETNETRYSLADHTAPVHSIDFSPDGRFLLSGGDDTRIILWSMDTGEIEREFTGGHRDGVLSVAFSPDGTRAVSGSRDSTAIIWDVQTGEPINRLFGHTFQILSVAFSPDGRQIVSAARDFRVIIWNTETGEVIRTFEAHNDWVFTAQFSPDGQSILSGGGENNLILWDVPSGQPLRTFEGHTSFIYDAAFSPDGRYAISAAADSQIILWDIETGDILQTFDAHTDDVRSVQFINDDRFTSGSGDDTVRVWQIRLEVEDLLTWVEDNRYRREFTCSEREQYNIAPLCPTATPIFDPGTT
jgi:WD40 repeat protein/serine/threonine protein kinase